MPSSLKSCLSLALGILVSLSSPPSSADELTVYAATSLQHALDDAVEAFEQGHFVKVSVHYGASDELARQIIGGAPADVFMPAGQKWMDDLDDRGLLQQGSRQTLLGNQLVLIALPDSTLSPVTFERGWDLGGALGSGRLAIADPDRTPAGGYVREALQTLGMWQQAKPHLLLTDTDLDARASVERGDAVLGIVYATDAVTTKIRVLAKVPADSHVPIEYPLAIVHGHDNMNALQFFGYLNSPSAAELFRQKGFEVR